MPIYPYSFQLPPLNVQDIPNDGAPGEFLGISAGGALDWLPAGGGGSGDMLAANNLSELTNFATARTNIGLGTASTPTFANLTLTSPSLSSSAPVTISQTWDALAVAFTAFKVNATSTNSAATSLFLDLQVGGGSKFKIGKDGSAYLQPYNGFSVYLRQTSNTYNLGIGLTNVVGGYGDVGLFQPGSGGLGPGWDVNNFAGRYSINGDTVLTRDGAGQLALRNGAAAQTFRVYNTYTDASNYERLDIGWTSNTLFIRNVKTGSGQNRDLVVTSGADMYLGSGNTDRWRIVNAGHFIGNVDNQYDIGASGANRPRNLYVGSNIYAAGNVGIGTTAPSQKLEVALTDGVVNTFEGIKLSKGTGYFGLYNGSSNTGFYGSFFAKGTAGSAFSLIFNGITGNDADTANPVIAFTARNNADTGPIGNSQISHQFRNYTTPLVSVLGSGNVGIGTTAPTANLHVSGVDGDQITKRVALFQSNDLNINNDFSVVGITSADPTVNTFLHRLLDLDYSAATLGSTGTYIRLLRGGTEFAGIGLASDEFVITTGATEKLRVTAAGNVGIGTTSPTSKLHVAGELGSNVVTYDSGAALRLTNTTVNSSWLLTSGIIGVANGHFSIRRDSVALPALVIAGITDNVGIGITTPTAKLHVAGTIKPEQATMVDTALTTYTLASTDAGTIINSTSATAVTVNLPTADTAAGYNVMIIQSGAGAVTIAANGNTRNSFGSAFTTAGQHAACSIVRTAASTYNLSGNLV